MNQLKPSQLESQPKKADAPPAGDKPALRQQKEKAPAVEDKPFAEFVQQDYLPALKTFAKQGVQNLELTLKSRVPIAGYNQADDCWQVRVVGRMVLCVNSISIFLKKIFKDKGCWV